MRSLPPLAFALLTTLSAGACSGTGEAQQGRDGPASGRVTVTVDGQGFHPASVAVRAGAPLTITFRRTTDQTCGTEVVFPALNIRKPLPLNEPVDVQLTPTAGTISFACGMDMLHGTLVAR